MNTLSSSFAVPVDHPDVDAALAETFDVNKFVDAAPLSLLRGRRSVNVDVFSSIIFVEVGMNGLKKRVGV